MMKLETYLNAYAQAFLAYVEIEEGTASYDAKRPGRSRRQYKKFRQRIIDGCLEWEDPFTPLPPQKGYTYRLGQIGGANLLEE
jgi:hypothetical protein